MKLVQFSETLVKGFCTHTKDMQEKDAKDPSVNKVLKNPEIEKLWMSFHGKMTPFFEKETVFFGVYSDYDPTDASKFSVLVGADKLRNNPEVALEEVRIQEGRYLVFEGKGEMPQCILDAWTEVYQYFASDDAAYTRKYSTDFEMYRSMNEVEIHVAVE